MPSNRVRLGHRERALLQEAAKQGMPPVPILPYAPTMSAQSSTRQAVARLVRAGLIEVVGEVSRSGRGAGVLMAGCLVKAGMARDDDPRLTWVAMNHRREAKARSRVRFMRRTTLGDEIARQLGQS